MKKVKLFEDYSIEEKKITIEWDDDNHSFVFSDGEVARVDYDGDFQYRGEWFQTIDHESGEDLIKDLEKKFKKDKFAYVGESYINEGKVKVFVDKIVSRMVEGGLGVSYSHKLREEIKDKIEGIVKDTLKKYDYVVESNSEDVKEGVWSKSALASMNRKSMDYRYFLTNENGDIIQDNLKTMSSVKKALDTSRRWDGTFPGYGVPKIINVHDLKKGGEVIEQWDWDGKWGSPRSTSDIDSQYIKYIPENLNESANDVNKSYDKIIELLKKEARKLNDDDAYELHEKLKTFFNKLF